MSSLKSLDDSEVTFANTNSSAESSGTKGNNRVVKENIVEFAEAELEEKEATIRKIEKTRRVIFERIRGGNVPGNEEDDLAPDDINEVANKRQQQLDAPKPVEPLKAADIKHYIKVALLVAIWLIYFTCLITKAEHKLHENQLVVPPNNTKEKPLNDQIQKNEIVVKIFGPFVVQQNFKKLPNSNQPQLLVQVQKEEENGQRTNITNGWLLLLQDPDNLYYVKSVSHEQNMRFNEDIKTLLDTNPEIKLYLIMQTNIAQEVGIKLKIDFSPVNKGVGIIIGTIVLLFLYVAIIWEVINRTFASLVACMMAIGGLAAMDSRPPVDMIITWIDVETLMLLFGMMVLVSVLSESGVFDYMAVYAYEIAKGNLIMLIYVLCVFTAVLSSFLDNVTMMLLLTPVTIRLCEATNLQPVPVLMVMVIYSNIGAALTPVGDPPNIIIMTNTYLTERAQINFGNFIAHMGPLVVLCMLSVFLHVRCFKYRHLKDFMGPDPPEIEAINHQIMVWERAAQHLIPSTANEEIVQNTLLKKVEELKLKLQEIQSKIPKPQANFQETLAHMKESYPIRNRVLLIKSTIAFVFVLVLFFLHTVPHLQHLSLGWSALLGALILLILADDQDMDSILSHVEWSTLLFFACLFVLMEALTRMGLIGVIGDSVVELILLASPKYQLLVAILLILWVTGIASAFLDNIPVTTMMVRIVINLAQNDQLELPVAPLVWALAMGACLGGNGTLIGASANVVASGVSEQHGYRFSFTQFFAIGFPVTINTLSVATVYLIICHCILAWH